MLRKDISGLRRDVLASAEMFHAGLVGRDVSGLCRDASEPCKDVSGLWRDVPASAEMFLFSAEMSLQSLHGDGQSLCRDSEL